MRKWKNVFFKSEKCLGNFYKSTFKNVISFRLHLQHLAFIIQNFAPHHHFHIEEHILNYFLFSFLLFRSDIFNLNCFSF